MVRAEGQAQATTVRQFVVILRSYILTLLSVMAIAAIEQSLHAPIDDKSRFLVLLIPVAVSTWIGGIGPGLMALVLSCLIGAFLYLPPKYSFLIRNPWDAVSLMLFVVVSLVLIAIIESLRRAQLALARRESEVRTLNSELERTLALKDEALRSQKRFTSDASHELKTPLTAIRARSGIALSGPNQPEELLEHIVAMNRASEVMIAVVQDLLLLAASDEGQLQLRKEPSQISVLVEDALASVDVSKHQVEVQVGSDLRMDCDPSAITRVLVNLLQNAVVHTPAGRKIEVAAVAVDEAVNLSVRDQGSGIPPEHLSRIFDRFHRVDRSRNREAGGSGLGLAIAKAIVDAHGGSISVVSGIGEGTTVTLTIPT